MQNHVPGVEVPDHIFQRLRKVPPAKQTAEGIKLAAEIVQQVAEIPGVAGVHLLVAGNERAVPDILQNAGTRGTMDVDLRPVRKLRESAAARSALGPIIEAVCASPADSGQAARGLRLDPVQAELPRAGGRRPIGTTDTEIAVDLRRSTGIDLEAEVKHALEDPAGLALESWVPGRDSCIWRFNALYWQALSEWEQATGKEYEQSLPGGESDARNTEAARELILELFRIWDELDARRALPDELYILELGVGNGNQARTWLDEFVQLDRRHGRDYYRRLRYLMGDYSPHVLERARRAVAHHGERISALVVDATRPSITLGFLSGKAFLVYISNVYDNLPTDELACIHGRTYQVQTQAFLTDDDADLIAGQFGIDRSTAGPADRPAAAHRARAAERVRARPVPRPRPERSASGGRRGTRCGSGNGTSRWRAWTATSSHRT